MRTGYLDPFEYSTEYFSYRQDNRTFFKNGTFHLNNSDIFSETIDLEKHFYTHKVDSSLEKIWLYGNEATLINTPILNEFSNLKEVFIYNTKLSNLDWLAYHPEMTSFTHSSTLSFGADGMTGAYYHPLKHLTKLQYLDLSFSHFSNDAINLSDNKTLFDNMLDLNYLNLRETSLTDVSFLARIKANDLLVNFIDNQLKLDFSDCEHIRLVTKIKVRDDTMMDISNYLGS